MGQLISPYSIAVLISGTGTNLQALVKAQQEGLLDAHIGLVISNEPKALGLNHAHKANIPTCIINHRDFLTRSHFDQAITNKLDQLDPNLIVLAGFMRQLTPRFVHQYYGKIINLHPSLLPKYKGLNTFERALNEEAKEHGSTVHFVAPELDAGPIISYARCSIQPHDTTKDLQERTKALEHYLLPLTVQYFAKQKVSLYHRQVMLEDRILPPEGTDLTQIIHKFTH